MRHVIFGMVLSLLFISPVLAQDASQAVENKTFYDDGKLHTKEFLLDGKRVGVFKEYWPNQKMKQKAVYDLNGVLNGYVRHHDDSGSITKKEFYTDGTLTRTINYDSNGQVIEEEE